MSAKVDWKFFFALSEASSKIMGDAASAGCLLKVGRRYGSMIAEGTAGSPDDRIKKAVKVLEDDGWGVFHDFPSGSGSVSYTVLNSVIATGIVSKGPVCNLLRGMFMGIFATIRGSEYACTESICRASGASTCQFLVSPAGGALK